MKRLISEYDPATLWDMIYIYDEQIKTYRRSSSQPIGIVMDNGESWVLSEGLSGKIQKIENDHFWVE